MLMMKMEVTPDCEIPAHVYNEAAELFLNHLRKFAVEKLLKGENPVGSCEKSRKFYASYIRPISPLGEYCPVIYKNSKGVRNVLLKSESQVRSILLHKKLNKVHF